MMLAIRFRSRAQAVVCLALVAVAAIAVGWWLSPARGVERSTGCVIEIMEGDPRADALIEDALTGAGCPVITHPAP